jgi:hypothetical protein
MTYYVLANTRPHSLCVSLLSRVESNLWTAVTTRKIIENSCIFSHAQNITTLRPNLVLPGTYRLLITNKSRSACPSENHCQGQQKIPHSVTVPTDSQLENFFIIYKRYQSFIYSPTDVLMSCFKKKTILKFTLKFTLKQLRHISVLQFHHHQGAH